MVNRNGVQEILEVPLNAAEQEKMSNSAAQLTKVAHDGFKALGIE